MSAKRHLLAAVLAGTTLSVAAAPAGAAGYGCAASAIRGTVLGKAIEPSRIGDLRSCRAAAAPGATLGAPLSAGALVARTDLTGETPASQQAGAIGAVSELRIGALASLPITLPRIELPAGLDAVRIALPQLAEVVPVTGALLRSRAASRGLNVPAADLPAPLGAAAATVTQAVTGVVDTATGVAGTVTGTAGTSLPAAITVDLRPAVEALAATLAAPDVDLLRVAGAYSMARAECIGGTPQLNGKGSLAGLTVLGQELPTDGALDRVLAITTARQVDLSTADLGRIALPAGLSLADPVVGPVLREALRSALAGLPALDVPALVGRVTVTPAAQQREGDTLVQRGPRVQVSVLGAQVADLVLSEARVARNGVACDAAPTVSAASQKAVSCAKRHVTLVDVAERAGHVSLLGAADARYVGEKVAIVFTATGRRVATGVVRPDGFFRAKAPLPPRSIRRGNQARYQAVLDGQRSLRLKLHRRMRIAKMSHRGNRVLIVGRITGPLAPGQEIVIKRRVSCTQDVVVKRIEARRAGAWRVWLPAPRKTDAGVYRATTQVRGAPDNPKLFPTYTLPGYVSL